MARKNYDANSQQILKSPARSSSHQMSKYRSLCAPAGDSKILSSLSPNGIEINADVQSNTFESD